MGVAGINGRKKLEKPKSKYVSKGYEFIKVESVDHLKEILKDGDGKDFIMVLNFGCKSSKHVNWDGKKFSIINMIDGSEQELTSKQLMSKKHTNIGDAIAKGAFWYERES